MLEFLLDVLGFGLKLILLVVLLVLPVIILITVAVKNKKGSGDKETALPQENLAFVDLKTQEQQCQKLMAKQLKNANPEQRLVKKELAAGLLPEQAKAKEAEHKKKKSKQGRKEQLQKKREERQRFVAELQQKRKAGEFCPRNLFVVDFKGSTKGSEFRQLRLQIDAILSVATEQDEVVINLNSPGGLVNSYGLCASQLQRLRDRNIFVTVTVDEVAASGGYLMACVANKIVAAPFSYIGSIGVIAGIPNFRRVLNRFDVDYEQVTAGKYKRTLSVFGENTPEGREKFKQELDAVHQRFKSQVQRYRPQLDMDKVATGEHWLAADALELGLVDEIATSDEYIHQRLQVTENSALKLKWKKQEKKKNLLKLLPFFSRLLARDSANASDDGSVVSGNAVLGAGAVTAAVAAASAAASASLAADESESDDLSLLQDAQEQLQTLEQNSFMHLR